MAGKFTGLRYDPDAYQEELQRSTYALDYRLDPNYANPESNCFAPYGSFRQHNNDVDVGQQIDVDSILRGLNKINSKSNLCQLPDSLEPYKISVPKDCSSTLETEYSRFTYPAFDIKGLTTKDLRLGYPLQDPQCQIFENFEVNTRLQAKDNFKATWQVPLDQRNSLPREHYGSGKNCHATINCNYKTESY